MKKVIFIITAVIISIISIFVAKPYVDAYQERQKYEFTLKTIDGDIKLSDFRGKAVAIYFGYMYCPDACPTSLSLLNESLKNFSKEQLEEFQGIFVSVDPERDSLKDLKEYGKYFNSSIIGTTGSEKNLKQITKNYGSYYVLEKASPEDKLYSVAHTSYFYIFDKEGNLSERVRHFTKPSEITEALKKVL